MTTTDWYSLFLYSSERKAQMDNATIVPARCLNHESSSKSSDSNTQFLKTVDDSNSLTDTYLRLENYCLMLTAVQTDRRKHNLTVLQFIWQTHSHRRGTSTDKRQSTMTTQTLWTQMMHCTKVAGFGVTTLWNVLKWLYFLAVFCRKNEDMDFIPPLSTLLNSFCAAVIFSA